MSRRRIWKRKGRESKRGSKRMRMGHRKGNKSRGRSRTVKERKRRKGLEEE